MPKTHPWIKSFNRMVIQFQDNWKLNDAAYTGALVGVAVFFAVRAGLKKEDFLRVTAAQYDKEKKQAANDA